VTAVRPAALLAALALALVACRSVEGPKFPKFLQGNANAKPLHLPGQYLGSGDRPASATAQEAPAPMDAQTLSRVAAERRQQADALWARAQAATSEDDKADLYDDVADDFPEYPNAAEARYRAGLHRYRAGDWTAAYESFKKYLEIAPVNPHLADLEAMIYRAGLAYIGQDHGILNIFHQPDTGLEMLRYVSVTFPAGSYADDALITLGRYYQHEVKEQDRAMLYFKELLQRYPDSEWSFEARRALAETYASRDQGRPYHAGFVDRDPREKVPDDPKAKAHAGPVKGALELALEQYDRYLERIRLDPGRQQEYARQVAQVQAERNRLREALAEKDDRVAAWYASQGQPRAAEVYRRSAARWRSGQTGTELPADTASASAPTGAPSPRPTPAPATATTIPTPTTPTPTRSPTPGTAPWGRVPPRPPPPATPPAARPTTAAAPTTPSTSTPLRVPPPPPPPTWRPGR
jgi:TolA-binding protein